MSQTAVLTPEETTPPGAPGKKKLVLVGLLVLLLAGAGGGWFLFGAPAGADEASVQDGEIVVLPPLTTTLGQAALHHARISIAVVLTDTADASHIEPKQALLQDRLLAEIAGMTADQIRSPEGSEQLRQRLSAAAREIWGEDVVRRVVLTELLVS